MVDTKPQQNTACAKMKTKWGTCNPKYQRIWVNLELVKETATLPRIRDSARIDSSKRKKGS